MAEVTAMPIPKEEAPVYAEWRDGYGEATPAEQAWADQEIAWASDPDWQAFQTLCYPESKAPSPAEVQAGVQRLVAAAERGHARAQHQLATELHLGQGRLGVGEDLPEAATWYAKAARNGHPLAYLHLRMLRAAHPEVFPAKQAE